MRSQFDRQLEELHLELMKMGKIYLTQEELFDDMNIETLEPEGEEGELNLEGLEDFEG